jgi:hypothetical protein
MNEMEINENETNRLRSKGGHPQDKSDYCRKVIRSKYTRSTLDGIAYQWHSNNPILKKKFNQKFHPRHFSKKKKTYAFNAFRTAGAVRSQVSFETSLAVELLLLFNKSNIVQFTFAIRHGATEMVRTPRLPQSRHELAS